MSQLLNLISILYAFQFIPISHGWHTRARSTFTSPTSLSHTKLCEINNSPGRWCFVTTGPVAYKKSWTGSPCSQSTPDLCQPARHTIMRLDIKFLVLGLICVIAIITPITARPDPGEVFTADHLDLREEEIQKIVTGRRKGIREILKERNKGIKEILKERRKSTKKVLEERRRGIEMILDSQTVVPDFTSFNIQLRELGARLSQTEETLRGLQKEILRSKMSSKI